MLQCHQPGSEKRLQDPSVYKDPLIKANQEAVRVEAGQIDDFIRRYGWNMESTETGIRYMITKSGSGAMTESGRRVELDYSLTLLNGDTVYTSAMDGPLVFQVGKGQVITGLEEAILLLRVGDKAKIIVPSHLAFGLIGDQDKIHHKASLVYDVELVRMY
ncbi:MAG: FKBP-type peptidyl-prolyl cis-trans isomerase [Bacteroidales bacterium]|nr:FKBP-type peptidyl-prolyl cis-trans isomerase [Bacteroidales bacterium]